MINPEIKDKISEITDFLKKKKITEAYLFGSACTDNFGLQSDIDMLVSFQEGLTPIEYGEIWWEVYEGLSSLLNREIDLINQNTIANPYFLDEIEKTKVRIL